MSADHIGHDPVLVAIASLRSRDVRTGHADRLRSQCHRLLEQRLRQDSGEPTLARLSLRRLIVPALASAWCVAYLWEILQRAATIYGY